MTILFFAGALLMRLGLAIYAAGSVRSKNVASVLGRNLLDWTICVLVFWAFGFAVEMNTGNPYFGINSKMLLGSLELAMHPSSLALISIVGAVTIGATAERSRIWPVISLAVMSAALTVPMVGHWRSLQGWLGNRDFVDFAGVGSMHVIGAVTALFAVRFVGARDGKYHRDGSASMIPGHSVPMILGGAWLAAIGGVTMICSRDPSFLQLLNALLGISASVLACAFYFQFRYSKIDLPVLAASLLGGVVAMSASGSFLSQKMAVTAGGVAGLLVTYSILKLDLVMKFDDVTSSISIHGIAGALGILASVFSTWNDDRHLQALLVQGGGLLAIIVLTGLISYATLALTKLLLPLRVTIDDEFDGLDLAEHDIGAYPDFQQNTIKSYHLREA